MEPNPLPEPTCCTLVPKVDLLLIYLVTHCRLVRLSSDGKRAVASISGTDAVQK